MDIDKLIATRKEYEIVCVEQANLREELFKVNMRKMLLALRLNQLVYSDTKEEKAYQRYVSGSQASKVQPEQASNQTTD